MKKMILWKSGVVTAVGIAMELAGFFRGTSHRNNLVAQLESNPIVRTYRDASETRDRLRQFDYFLSEATLPYHPDNVKPVLEKAFEGINTSERTQATSRSIQIIEQDMRNMFEEHPEEIAYATSGRVTGLRSSDKGLVFGGAALGIVGVISALYQLRTRD